MHTFIQTCIFQKKTSPKFHNAFCQKKGRLINKSKKQVHLFMDHWIYKSVN